MSKLTRVAEHPLKKLLDAAGLSGRDRTTQYRILATAARAGFDRSLFEPRTARCAIIGYEMWAAWQNRTGDRPRPSSVDFNELPHPLRQPWLEIAASVMPILAFEVME